MESERVFGGVKGLLGAVLGGAPVVMRHKHTRCTRPLPPPSHQPLLSSFGSASVFFLSKIGTGPGMYQFLWQPPGTAKQESMGTRETKECALRGDADNWQADEAGKQLNAKFCDSAGWNY